MRYLVLLKLFLFFSLSLDAQLVWAQRKKNKDQSPQEQIQLDHSIKQEVPQENPMEKEAPKAQNQESKQAEINSLQESNENRLETEKNHSFFEEDTKLKNINDFINPHQNQQIVTKKKSKLKASDIQSLKDAKNKEFEQYSQENPPGSLSHTLMAFAPGLLIHGAGHWAQGDLYSASRLLIAQGFSLLALGASVLLEPYQNNSTWLSFAHRTLEHSGIVLFLGSWFADMMGTFRGSGSFYEDSSRQFSSRFSLGYRYTMDPLFNLRHHIHTGLKLHFKYFYFSPSINWESKGNLKGVELDMGTRLMQWGEGQIDFISLGIQGRRWEWSELGFAQVNSLLYLHWRWHLKNFLHGLGGTSFFQKAGIGIDAYQFASNQNVAFLEGLNQDRLYLSLQSGLSINFAEDLHFQISYIQDPTRDVRPIKNGDKLWGLQLISRQGSTLDIQAQALIGEAWSGWLILNYHFGELQRHGKKAFKEFQQ